MVAILFANVAAHPPPAGINGQHLQASGNEETAQCRLIQYTAHTLHMDRRWVGGESVNPRLFITFQWINQPGVILHILQKS